MRFLKNLFLGLTLFALAANIAYNPQLSAFFQKGTGLVRDVLAYRTNFSADTLLTPQPADAKADAAVTKITPSVVSIYGTSNLDTIPDQEPYLEGLSRIFQPIRRRASSMIKMSAGTGFFIDSDGYILTNKHVVADEQASYSVQLAGGTRKNASVIYRDPNHDLAIIKISGKNYPTVSLGDSSKIKVGQNILGIGNAYGKFPNTVSQGNISALHRTVITSDDEPQRLENIIQTSAQLYPGDSGGPLFDLAGNVVGIDVAIAANRANMSFSIPINDAKDIISAINQNQLSFAE